MCIFTNCLKYLKFLKLKVVASKKSWNRTYIKIEMRLRTKFCPNVNSNPDQLSLSFVFFRNEPEIDPMSWVQMGPEQLPPRFHPHRLSLQALPDPLLNDLVPQGLLLLPQMIQKLLHYPEKVRNSCPASFFIKINKLHVSFSI